MSFEFKNYRTPEDHFATDSSEEDESSLDSGDGDYIQEADQVKSSRIHMWRIIYFYCFPFLFNKRQIGWLSKYAASPQMLPCHLVWKEYIF